MTLPSLSLHLIDPDAPALPLVLATSLVAAGFPSPADDYLEDRIDLTRELVRNPTTSFLARVKGDSMRDAGLADGDLILIDRSIRPRTNHMVLAWVDGGFTVKYLELTDDRCVLRAAHPDYADLEFREEEDARVWGVVTHIIHACNRGV